MLHLFVRSRLRIRYHDTLSTIDIDCYSGIAINFYQIERVKLLTSAHVKPHQRRKVNEMSKTSAEIASQPEVWAKAAEVAKQTGPLATDDESVAVIGCGT